MLVTCDDVKYEGRVRLSRAPCAWWRVDQPWTQPSESTELHGATTIVPVMDIAYLLPKEAAARGVPKASAYRARTAFGDKLGDRILVVDGRAISDPAEIADLMTALAARAEAAESALARETEARYDAEADLLGARAELDQANARQAEAAPVLAEIASQVTQLLNVSLRPPSDR